MRKIPFERYVCGMVVKDESEMPKTRDILNDKLKAYLSKNHKLLIKERISSKEIEERGCLGVYNIAYVIDETYSGILNKVIEGFNEGKRGYESSGDTGFVEVEE